MVLLANSNPSLAQAAWQLQLAAVTCIWGLLSDHPRSGACRLCSLAILEAAIGAASTGQRVVVFGERCGDTVRETRAVCEACSEACSARKSGVLSVCQCGERLRKRSP